MNRCGACKHYEPPRVVYEEWGRCGKERRYPKVKKPESWACLDYEDKKVSKEDKIGKNKRYDE